MSRATCAARPTPAPASAREQQQWNHGIDYRRQRATLQTRNSPSAPSGPSPASSAGGTIAGLLAAGSSALALYFARRVITPAAARHEDQEVLAVIRGGKGQQVILAATPDSHHGRRLRPVLRRRQGHARIGRIVSYSPAERTVLREVEAVYSGDLSAARRGMVERRDLPGSGRDRPGGRGRGHRGGRRDGAGLADPGRSVGCIAGLGDHGPRTRRDPAGRAAGSPHRHASWGMASLLISYRNDGLAPSAPDGRYGLGSTEWRDVEAAIEYALDHGAAGVVLFGWSMGGAICLQTADLSRTGT